MLQWLWDLFERKAKHELAEERPELDHELLCPHCGQPALTFRTRSMFRK